ncbi:hypothetical protein, partial [Caldisalinibacter kiritimatiensis]|uniref:hypothetical protein n=1 Tax=Caldisalinibacter kiritimatiensis TaxID=1304284 RepID=UPI00055271E4
EEIKGCFEKYTHGFLDIYNHCLSFHFIQVPVSICGNFDLSFPMFFADSNGLNIYEDIARKCGLNIRDTKIIADKYKIE